MTKEKGQKEKEKLEDTKEVFRSVNRRRTDNTMTKLMGKKGEE